MGAFLCTGAGAVLPGAQLHAVHGARLRTYHRDAVPLPGLPHDHLPGPLHVRANIQALSCVWLHPHVCISLSLLESQLSQLYRVERKVFSALPGSQPDSPEVTNLLTAVLV